MKIKMKIWACVAVLSLLPLSLAGASVAGPEYTIAEFAVDLANMITNKADFSAVEAVSYLKRVGVELPDTLDSEVDEQSLVEMLTQVGVQLGTSNPDRIVTARAAEHLFQMFDSNDILFAGELFKTCQQGSGEPRQCITDADCAPGHSCTVVNSIKCQSGPNDGEFCESDADCPMGTCKIPPGQQRKLDPASPSD